MAKFFRFPWAVTGDKTVVPDPIDPGGAVSYSQGFGPDYERDPATDPLAKRVPRAETNQYLFDLTDNLRQYQLNGVPEWYPASENGGVAISYPIGSRVRHNDLTYGSLVANNTVEPGTDPAKWALDGVIQTATETRFGTVRLATMAEAAARTATDRVVTPAGLGTLFDMLSNNPVFPEVLNASGLFNLSTPAPGTFRVEAGTKWTWRGLGPFTSVETDLPTLANKTYHARWTKSGGFVLEDLSSGSYNPAGMPEASAVFDTNYDNMLIAKVTTSSGNVLTITPLVNFAVLKFSGTLTGTDIQLSGLNGANLVFVQNLNWSRAPSNRTLTFMGNGDHEGDTDFNIFAPGPSRVDPAAMAAAPSIINVTRNLLLNIVMYDGVTMLKMHFDARA